MSTQAQPSFGRRAWVSISAVLGGFALVVMGASLTISAAPGPVPSMSSPQTTQTSPPPVAHPSPSETATPSATSTPTARPTAPAEVVVCSTARISAPSIKLDAKIDEYTYKQLVWKDGTWVVKPSEEHLDRATWYSGLYREFGLDSIMSAKATYPVLLYGHRYRSLDIDAVFDNLRDLKLGDIVTVTNCAGEVIRLVVEDKFKVKKQNLSDHVDISQPDPGVWYAITCHSDNDDPNSGPPPDNTVVKLRVLES